MNNPFFAKMCKLLASRRPSWGVIIEDEHIRIITNQMVVDWALIEEILEEKNLKMQEVMTHPTCGIVITITYNGGK